MNKTPKTNQKVSAPSKAVREHWQVIGGLEVQDDNAAFVEVACNNYERVRQIVAELANFQFSNIASKQGYKFALKQLCQIKRKARLALGQEAAQ